MSDAVCGSCGRKLPFPGEHEAEAKPKRDRPQKGMTFDSPEARDVFLSDVEQWRDMLIRAHQLDPDNVEAWHKNSRFSDVIWAAVRRALRIT